ncbi:hypothetical protein ARMSODRAFT_669556 [Armillaria solidipes]|uniref:Uncharacterized protein n=1 Tax=Armillaria solidipes TaxID=1076256 RepID=A0A2H3AUW2_9AGAR|nr:hypothetical protein ARMSODRAFT_669556 [Armillaria solidipes]
MDMNARTPKPRQRTGDAEGFLSGISAGYIHFPLFFHIIMADFSQHPASGKYLTDDEIAEVASKLRIADPDKDNGVFNTVNHMEALVWLKYIGVSGLSPLESPNEEVIEKLCYVLWDSQRIDSVFHGKTYQTSSKLDVTVFPAWPNWEKANLELKSNTIGAMKMDGYKDAKRLDS